MVTITGKKNPGRKPGDLNQSRLVIQGLFTQKKPVVVSDDGLYEN